MKINIRAWDKIDNRMAPVEELHRGWVAIPVYDEDGGHLEKRKLDDVVLMLDTGLHDKNGKEIYEGDILGKKNPEDVGGFSGKWKIEFGHSTCDDYGSETIGYRMVEKDYEIIGNIYENPELLNK